MHFCDWLRFYVRMLIASLHHFLVKVEPEDSVNFAPMTPQLRNFRLMVEAANLTNLLMA